MLHMTASTPCDVQADTLYGHGMQGGLDLSGGLGGARNAGVDDRNRRDAEQVQTDATREADSYAALQRKARRRSATAHVLQFWQAAWSWVSPYSSGAVHSERRTLFASMACSKSPVTGHML